MNLFIYVVMAMPLLLKGSVSDPCVVENYVHDNKLINVVTEDENDALKINLTVDYESRIESSLQFNIKIDHSGSKAQLENVMVNNKLLCAVGGRPALSTTAHKLHTKIPFEEEKKPSSSPIRENPDRATLNTDINPSPTNCNIPFEEPTDFYYWKEYKGNVPKDAFVGTIDKSRRPIYIGSGLWSSPQSVMPGPLYAGDKSAYSFAFGRLVESTHNVKVLCAPNKEKLSWVKVHLDDIDSMTNCHFIQGGYEYTYPGPMLIGRLKVGKEYTIGKVILVNDKYRGFESYHNGKHYFKIQKFEALAICNDDKSE